MNGREALKALADGKRVRRIYPREPQGEVMTLESSAAFAFASDGAWEVVEDPATDEDLIAEFERLASETGNINERFAYAHCARMLRERKVRP